MPSIPTHYYALNRWFALAQGDEPLLIRILADTAGLKGWLSRPLHEQLSHSDLATVLSANAGDSFEIAATYLLSQMPQFQGPESESEWQQWLTQWALIHKQKTPVEQIDLLPQRFDRVMAEQVLQQLNQAKTATAIPATSLS